MKVGEFTSLWRAPKKGKKTNKKILAPPIVLLKKGVFILFWLFFLNSTFELSKENF